jgi:hypothetical protein
LGWQVQLGLVIATVLDPIKKMYFLEFFYEKMCQSFEDYEVSVGIIWEWHIDFLN